GRYNDALEAYNRMIKINPAERVIVSYNRARVFMYQHRLDDADAELELGAQMEPNHPLIKTMVAILRACRGACDEAARITGEDPRFAELMRRIETSRERASSNQG